MKSDNTLETRQKRHAFGILGHDPDTRPSPAPESGDNTAAHQQTTQEERGVMHPDRDDVEWRYWRGGWGRLTE